jgi:hypothetical protein
MALRGILILRVGRGKLTANGDLSAVKVGSRLVRIHRASLAKILQTMHAVAPVPRRGQ